MNFQKSVLILVKRIPKGKVTTYRDIALKLNTRAYRAVGQALKANPEPIRVPCHRVVCSDGSMGGYRGKETKEKEGLLRKECVEIINGRVDLDRFLHKL